MHSLSGILSGDLGRVQEDPENPNGGNWEDEGEGFPGRGEFLRAVGEVEREIAGASAAVDRLASLHEKRKVEVRRRTAPCAATSSASSTALRNIVLSARR